MASPVIWSCSHPSQFADLSPQSHLPPNISTFIFFFLFSFFPFESCFSRSCTNNHTTIFRNFPQCTSSFECLHHIFCGFGLMGRSSGRYSGLPGCWARGSQFSPANWMHPNRGFTKRRARHSRWSGLIDGYRLFDWIHLKLVWALCFLASAGDILSA